MLLVDVCVTVLVNVSVIWLAVMVDVLIVVKLAVLVGVVVIVCCWVFVTVNSMSMLASDQYWFNEGIIIADTHVSVV